MVEWLDGSRDRGGWVRLRSCGSAPADGRASLGAGPRGHAGAHAERGLLRHAFDAEGLQNMMGRHTRGMTISMVRQGAAQTKVKIRFDNVYYPRVVEEYYKVVWNAVAKQMFLDKALD